jgi:hypothetical protein
MLILLLSAALLDGMIIGSSSLDLITTEIALNHSNQLREGNPLMQDSRTRLGLKILSTGLAIGVTHELRKRKKYKAAKIFAISTSVFWGGIAVRNAILTRQH